MAKCCDYSAGMLREVISLQRASRKSNFGGIDETWAAVSGAPDRAYMKPLSGREVFASQRVEARASIMMVIRYFADIKERDRIVWNSREYNIRHIRNVEARNKWLEIMLEEGVAV